MPPPPLSFEKLHMQGDDMRAMDTADHESDDGRGGSLSAALLLEASAIENRLRRHCLELLEPTIQKQKQQEAKVKELRSTAETIGADVTELKRLTDGQESLRGQIDAFRAELAEWDRERRDHQQQVGDRTSLLDIEITELKKAHERKKKDFESVNRVLKGYSDGVGEVRSELAELRRYCNERLDLGRDKLAKLRDEFETRVTAVETEQFKLRDTQMGIDTDMDHVKRELVRMSTEVNDVVQGVSDLWRAKVSVQCVEAQQQEFNEFSRRVDAHVSGLGKQFGDLVQDLKAHFHTATQVVGQDTSKQMETMRSKYKEEVRRVDDIVEQFKSFLEKQETVGQAMDERLEEVTEEFKKETSEIRAGLADLLTKRDRVSSELNIEVKQLSKAFKDLEARLGKDAANGGLGGGSISKDLLSMIVESSLMSAALDLKDDSDRRSIALFGYKPGGDGGISGMDMSLASPGRKAKARGSDKTCALPELDSTSGSGWYSARGGAKFRPTATGGGAAGGGGSGLGTPRRRRTALEEDEVMPSPVRSSGDTIVTLDQRCLSCSGSQATVLAGFKMACLQYAPSPVEFEQVTYSRGELITLRADMLRQVREQLRQAE